MQFAALSQNVVHILTFIEISESTSPFHMFFIRQVTRPTGTGMRLVLCAANPPSRGTIFVCIMLWKSGSAIHPNSGHGVEGPIPSDDLRKFNRENPIV